MKKLFFIFLSFVFLSGCATTYRVKFNGYLDITQTNTPIPPGSSFFVISEKNVKNPIFENEIKSKIEGLLKQRGFNIGSFENADFFIDFVYSMSAGRVVTEIAPVYHSGGVGTVRTFSSSGRTSISYIDYPGYTTYYPHKYTVYTSTLVMDVLDAGIYRASKGKKNIWIGEASNCSEYPDIREAINYLLAASFGYFGQDTHASVTTNISRDDPRMKELLP